MSTPDLKYRKFWLSIGWAMVLLIVYLSLMHNPPELAHFPMVDKVEHCSAYGLLMLWFCQIYWVVQARIGLAVGFVLLGVGMEVLQGFEGFRTFDYNDMLANTAGVLLGWGFGQTMLKQSLRYVEQKIRR